MHSLSFLIYNYRLVPCKILLYFLFYGNVEQQRLLDEQQQLYDERARLKKEARMIDTLKANVDDFLKPNAERDQEHQRNSQRE